MGVAPRAAAQDAGLRQKMLALLFPVGTWAVNLSLYYAGGRRHDPALGVPFLSPYAVVRLAGFVVILAGNSAYVALSSSAGAELPRAPALLGEPARAARVSSPAPD